jgi:hypothetical protein
MTSMAADEHATPQIYPPQPYRRQSQSDRSPTTITNWAVLSRFSSAPLVATGATCDPQSARQQVERILLENDAAGLGQLTREVIPFTRPTARDWQQWPPVGQILMCRRNSGGGCTWWARHQRPDMDHEGEAEDGN